MKRKVFRNGPSFVITLPTKWTKEYSIENGSELDLAINGSSITIDISGGKSLGCTNINTKGIDRTFLRCAIRNAYKRGYDELRINYDNSKLKHHRLNREVSIHKIVSEEVENLIGFEVVDSGENVITIRGFSNENREDFDIFLRKIFLNIIQYAKDLESISKDDNAFESLEIKHWNIKKFVNYCIRILNKKGHKTSDDVFNLYHIVSNLDIILGLIQYTGRYLQENKFQFSEKTEKINEGINDLIRIYYDLFYNYSIEKVVGFSIKRNEIKKEIVEISNYISPKETIFLERFYQVVEILYRLTEIRMDLERND